MAAQPDALQPIARRDRLRASFFPSSSDLKRRVVRGASVAFLGVGLRMLLTIGSTAVLARLLTPADFGIVALASIVTEFAGLLGNFGLTAILIQKKRLARIDCDTVFWFSLVFGLAITSLVALGSPLFASLLGDSNAAPIIAGLALLFVLEQLTVVPHSISMRLMLFGVDLKAQLITLAVRALVAIVLAKLGWGAFSLVLGGLVGKSAGLLYSYYQIPFLPRLRFFGPIIWRNIKVGGSYFANGIAGYVISNIDYFVIGRRFGVTDLGYYQAAFSLSDELRNRLAGPLHRVLFPAYSLVQSEPERFRRGVEKSLGLLSAVVWPLGLGMLAVAEHLVALLYGAQWLAAVPLLRVLAIAGAVRAIVSLTASVFFGLNRPDLALRINLLSLPFIAVAVLVGSRWGTQGVAVAMLAAQVFGVVYATIALRLVQIGMLRLFAITGRPLAPAVLMAAFVITADSFLASTGLGSAMSLGLLVTGGAAVYGIALHVFARPIAAEMREIATSLLAGKKA
jgi:PST family polysaccharide transporter